jgi:hypothetical protein
MQLVALYVKHAVMTKRAPWYSQYPPLAVAMDFISRPVSLPNEQPLGTYLVPRTRGEVETNVYNIDQIGRHLDYLQGFTGEICLKVVGGING